MSVLPSRGEIWPADLNPTRGHEQSGARPMLIVSTNTFNHRPAGIVFVLPLTRTDRRIPIHIPIDPPEGGVSARNFILCDALRSITSNRLGPRPWGQVSATTLRLVEDHLRMLMEL